jgi:hypothetical protein
MFDKIRSFFGKGKIKVEWEGIGPKGLESGTAKIPYTGLYDENALIDHFKNTIRMDYDIVCTKVAVIAHVQE